MRGERGEESSCNNQRQPTTNNKTMTLAIFVPKFHKLGIFFRQHVDYLSSESPVSSQISMIEGNVKFTNCGT